MMDEYTPLDALSNARVVLEGAEEALSVEQYQGIRRFVFPLLEAEWERLEEEYRLRGIA